MSDAHRIKCLEAEIEHLNKAADSNAREADRCRAKYMELKSENDRLRAELENGKVENPALGPRGETLEGFAGV